MFESWVSSVHMMFPDPTFRLVWRHGLWLVLPLNLPPLTGRQYTCEVSL